MDIKELTKGLEEFISTNEVAEITRYNGSTSLPGTIIWNSANRNIEKNISNIGNDLSRSQ